LEASSFARLVDAFVVSNLIRAKTVSCTLQHKRRPLDPEGAPK
jgi:hypothetical protein